MQSNPTYVNVMEEIKEFLQIQAEEAQEAGVKKERIWIDPGIGFGKTVEHNLAILRHFEQFVEIGYPVLIGVSRKAFLAKIASQDEPLLATERVEASIAAVLYVIRILELMSVDVLMPEAPLARECLCVSLVRDRNRG